MAQVHSGREECSDRTSRAVTADRAQLDVDGPENGAAILGSDGRTVSLNAARRAVAGRVGHCGLHADAQPPGPATPGRGCAFRIAHSHRKLADHHRSARRARSGRPDASASGRRAPQRPFQYEPGGKGTRSVPRRGPRAVKHATGTAAGSQAAAHSSAGCRSAAAEEPPEDPAASASGLRSAGAPLGCRHSREHLFHVLSAAFVGRLPAPGALNTTTHVPPFPSTNHSATFRCHPNAAGLTRAATATKTATARTT